jgi:hypothetical protein
MVYESESSLDATLYLIFRFVILSFKYSTGTTGLSPFCGISPLKFRSNHIQPLKFTYVRSAQVLRKRAVLATDQLPFSGTTFIP